MTRTLFLLAALAAVALVMLGASLVLSSLADVSSAVQR